MSDEQDTTKFNADVQAWTRASVAHMRAKLPVRSGAASRALNVRIGKRFGRAVNIAYGFPRYTVFVEKGARRGHGGAKGSQWKDSNGVTHKTAVKSLGKMNTGRAKAQPWFNPVLDADVPKLADIAVSYAADRAINAIRIR